ncbi:uncharacterized protein PV09_01179 [Verruconis gallopava]|uniref:Threonine/serine exporter-like N-terminal domain-containing protein n=1 Tax=Verruconis gallopava TaxID=253628 RepID=A0A0D1Z5J7_9PEZI|nr:uncharacterized protein PV09_01179 [Verruconis gallopava]KIW08252.1 hypothetical protein PV09_01179 [Verruconis gallopava]
MDEHPHQDSGHELHNLASSDLSNSSNQLADESKRSVRINSHAAVIPPPENVSRTQQDDLESTVTSQDETSANAESLWRAHTKGEPVGDHTIEAPFADSEKYSVSSSTQGGIFYQLLQAYKNPDRRASDSPVASTPPSPRNRPGSSGRSTPRKKWYEHEKSGTSHETLATLVGASKQLANPNSKDPNLDGKPRLHHKRNSSGNIIAKALKPKEDQDTKIKFHVASILKRQQYLIRMCRAMMLYGAPTHRLEESLAQSAKILDINSQFLYIPGCMFISFDDYLTHTAEVKIVRCNQGVNLSKLKDTHEIYKEVLHDIIGLDDALSRLDEVINAKDRYPLWLNVIMYGLASTAVSTFFKARPIDLPICFLLGLLLGILQLVVTQISKTYSTIFEITATILISFLARAFGSIRGGSVFCFSALAQSGIAMILPGFLVLNSALELQSKAIVPGSIRLVYAILYSLFLGYGITVGTALYGAMDKNATTATTCENPPSSYWNFLFVPLYVVFACFTLQAKYTQMPAMVLVSFCGYVVNFYSNMKFSASAPIAYTFGAFAVGVMANLYSRIRHGVAVTILLPAVFVQVPGSLASSGSIVAALNTANSLIRGSEQSTNSSENLNSLNAIVFNFAGGMIQISLGITVGLFFSTLLVYPLGKRRSGLWTL